MALCPHWNEQISGDEKDGAWSKTLLVVNAKFTDKRILGIRYLAFTVHIIEAL